MKEEQNAQKFVKELQALYDKYEGKGLNVITIGCFLNKQENDGIGFYTGEGSQVNLINAVTTQMEQVEAVTNIVTQAALCFHEKKQKNMLN